MNKKAKLNDLKERANKRKNNPIYRKFPNNADVKLANEYAKLLEKFQNADNPVPFGGSCFPRLVHHANGRGYGKRFHDTPRHTLWRNIYGNVTRA